MGIYMNKKNIIFLAFLSLCIIFSVYINRNTETFINKDVIDNIGNIYRKNKCPGWGLQYLNFSNSEIIDSSKQRWAWMCAKECLPSNNANCDAYTFNPITNNCNLHKL